MTDKPTETSRAQAGSARAEPARERVVVKDKRKIDPTGTARPDQDAKHPEPAPATEAEQAAAPEAAAPEGAGTEAASEVVSGEVVGTESATTASGSAGAASAGNAPEEAEATKPLGAELEALRAELDERLRDLQRVTAEYANYRKRVERDRGVVAEQAIGMVVGALLPILDDLDRAREHGDLTGPFSAVADQLNAALAKFGLAGFGEPGDAFDPTRHEAVAHQTSADVTEPTCVEIMRRGYLLGDRLLRPAMVAVADPE